MNDKITKTGSFTNTSVKSNTLFDSGEGTESNPYMISNYEDFDNIRNNLSSFYRLTADIDFEGKTLIPIGTMSILFAGGIDGDNHVLKNFKILSETSFTGLFANANKAKFKNLEIKNAEAEQTVSNTSCLGILAGYMNECTIENITMTDILVKGYTNVGGFAGRIFNSTINNIHLSDVNALGGSYTGGLSGDMISNKIENISFEDIIVTGKTNVGALAGRTKGGSILRCRANKNIKITGTKGVGGLTGVAEDSINVKECCLNVSVAGDDCLGGLSGIIKTGSAVENCSVEGHVISRINDYKVGGLTGYATDANIKNSYAACYVSQGASGLAFVNDKNTVVHNSFFDGIVGECGKTDKYNIGKLTAALVRQSFYIGWDFQNIWNIEEGKTYPYLKKIGRPQDDVETGPIITGSGREGDPYLIANAQGFCCIRYDRAGYYRIIADIDFEGSVLTPVGIAALPFTGGLDGDGKVLKNFRIIGESNYIGLIGYADKAKITNIKIEDGIIEQSLSNISEVGVLVGHASYSTIENICLSNLKVMGSNYTGALVGYLYGGNISCCGVDKEISVNGLDNVGGLIGFANNTANIKESSFFGKVTGNSRVGGLVGSISTSSVIKESSAIGEVKSKINSNYTGGLAGNASSVNIQNSYASCHVSQNGSGLVTVNDKNTIVKNSYFDSTKAGITIPETQARTTEQMLSRETYTGWDLANIWEYNEEDYPGIRRIQLMKQKPFELKFRELTTHSVLLEWPDIPQVVHYEVVYKNKVVNSDVPWLLIENLSSETEYEFKVKATVQNAIKVWSESIQITTRKFILNGIHSTKKDIDSITLTWNSVEGANRYEVFCENQVQQTDTNSCTLKELNSDTTYKIKVRALMADGGHIFSSPVLERIYTLAPQTEYAVTFIEKCEGETWFMNEIENLLNLQGKSINIINSNKDFDNIYAIGLTNRGLSGRIPTAVNELLSLKYLYLDGNSLRQ